jgi:hypothetical protein
MPNEKILLTEISEWQDLLSAYQGNLSLELSNEREKNTRRKTKPQMRLEEKLELQRSFDNFLNSNNPALKLFDPESRKKAKQLMVVELSKLPQEKLVEMLSSMIIDNSNLRQIASYLGDEKLALMRKLESAGDASLDKAMAISKGLKDKYAPNHELLMECLNIFKSKVNRAITPCDYIKFKALVLKTYPTQPVIPALKRNKEEMLQSEEIQKANAQAGKRTKWSEGKLRDFFEEQLGVNPSSVRK